MSLVLTDDTNYKNIANAIRAKTGTKQAYQPENMAAAIESIPGTEMEDVLITRPSTFTTYRNDRIVAVGTFALYEIATLTTVILKNAESVGNSGIASLRALKSAYLPKVKRFNYNGMRGDTVLEILSLPSVENIGSGTFYGNTNFAYLVLPGSTVCSNPSTINFTNTKIESGEGGVYVNESLVEQYKVETNWVAIADQIHPISELPPEIQALLDEQEALYGTN